MTKEEADFIGSMNMCDEISNEAYKKIMCNCEVEESQPRWIPCSERMPEVSDYYLIQHSRHICPDEMAVAYYSVEEAELDKNYTWEFKPFADCKEVIAWMPLPKHFEPQEIFSQEEDLMEHAMFDDDPEWLYKGNAVYEQMTLEDFLGGENHENR